MTQTTVETLLHILDARIDHAVTVDARLTWRNARDIITYALEDNIECLRQYDYLLTNKEIKEQEEEEEAERNAERESLGTNWW